MLKRVLEAGRYELPKGPEFGFLGHRRHPRVEVQVVDVRERELTIKGQEILTSDKLARKDGHPAFTFRNYRDRSKGRRS